MISFSYVCRSLQQKLKQFFQHLFLFVNTFNCCKLTTIFLRKIKITFFFLCGFCLKLWFGLDLKKFVGFSSFQNAHYIYFLKLYYTYYELSFTMYIATIMYEWHHIWLPLGYLKFWIRGRERERERKKKLKFVVSYKRLYQIIPLR